MAPPQKQEYDEWDRAMGLLSASRSLCEWGQGMLNRWLGMTALRSLDERGSPAACAAALDRLLLSVRSMDHVLVIVPM
jgi:hypothetical protein